MNSDLSNLEATTPAIKVSIVIPCFNSECYIEQCLNSAIDQTLKNIEVICIDDKSTDSTPSILKRFQKTSNKIRIITNPVNLGVAATRNIGIESSNGQYIFFMDSDDTIPLNALASLYSKASKYNSDLVKGCFSSVTGDKYSSSPLWITPEEETINTNIQDSLLLQRIPSSHCSYLYEKSLLAEHDINYPTDLIVGEDLVMLANAIVNAKAVYLTRDIVYHYHHRKESATRGSITANVAIDAIRAQCRIAEILSESGLHDSADLYLNKWSFHITEYWQRMVFGLDFEECRKVFSEARLAIGVNSSPWILSTPYHHRYLLILLTTKQDRILFDVLKHRRRDIPGFNQWRFKGSLDIYFKLLENDLESLINLKTTILEKSPTVDATTYLSSLFDRVKLRTETLVKDGRVKDAQDTIHMLYTYLQDQNVSEESVAKPLQYLINNSSTDHAKIYRLISDLLNVNRELEIEQEMLETQIEEIDRLAGISRRKMEARTSLFFSSLSWRLTAPIRKLIDAFF